MLPDIADKVAESDEVLDFEFTPADWVPKYFKQQVVAGMNYETAYLCETDPPKWMVVKSTVNLEEENIINSFEFKTDFQPGAASYLVASIAALATAAYLI